jgi:hypothetical protein
MSDPQTMRLVGPRIRAFPPLPGSPRLAPELRAELVELFLRQYKAEHAELYRALALVATSLT